MQRAIGQHCGWVCPLCMLNNIAHLQKQSHSVISIWHGSLLTAGLSFFFKTICECENKNQFCFTLSQHNGYLPHNCNFKGWTFECLTKQSCLGYSWLNTLAVAPQSVLHYSPPWVCDERTKLTMLAAFQNSVIYTRVRTSRGHWAWLFT